MNIRHKFILWNALLLLLVAVTGSVVIWQLAWHWRAARATIAAYDAMDRAETVASQLSWLRDNLRSRDARTYLDIKQFEPFRKEVDEIVAELRSAASLEEGNTSAELEHALAAATHLENAITHATKGPAPANVVVSGRATQASSAVEEVRMSLLSVAKLIPGSNRRHVTVSAERLSGSMQWTALLLLMLFVLSVVVHWKQYRMLVRPLLWLRDDMQRSASSQYMQEVRPRGDKEFADVATFFNGLAKELAELYRGMEQKIIQRSRELVRSERLASVGFLAAGVAHEINNPLSIISGYAELAAKGLRRAVLGPSKDDSNASTNDAEAEAEALASALEAQDVIREEAFRCKEITSRLLSIARGGGDGRQSLCMDDVARQVTVLTKGLKNYRDRRVILDFERDHPLEVEANPTEMKQVLLNLTVNALEAAPADRGEVRIGGRRSGQWIELSIEDNGKGMSPETLEHVFEPFFTAKRGAGEPGTGLGLSITHAIVENHGGRIRAESNGPGRGSRFTVRLPARGGLEPALS